MNVVHRLTCTERNAVLLSDNAATVTVPFAVGGVVLFVEGLGACVEGDVWN